MSFAEYSPRSQEGIAWGKQKATHVDSQINIGPKFWSRRLDNRTTHPSNYPGPSILVKGKGPNKFLQP